MLARHSDNPEAVERNKWIGDLVVDDIAHAIRLGPYRFIVEGAVHPEIIVGPIGETVLGQPADALPGFDVVGDGRVLALVDREIVGLQPLEAAEARLPIAARKETAMPAGVGRKSCGRNLEGLIAQDVERSTLRRPGLADIDGHLVPGNRPVWCAVS